MAYSVTKDLAVFGSYRTMIDHMGWIYPVFDKPENYNNFDREVAMSGERYEGGFGYYHNFNDINIWEVLVGYGY